MNRGIIGARAVVIATLGALALQAQPLFFTLANRGPTSNRVNVVFLAEGYRDVEVAAFTNHAQVLAQRILSTPPVAPYRQYFNVFGVFVPSRESGSDHPSSGAYRDTYFNSSYDSYGLARLITIPPNEYDSRYQDGQGKVVALLRQFVPEYDLPILVVNDPEYGGSGGSPVVTSVHASSAEVAVHELGHLFAGLGDEYGAAYPGYPDLEEPNTTTQTDRSLLKWRDWVLPTTPVPTPALSSYAKAVGLFEGAHYHEQGWFRPKLDCKMRSLGAPFCEVCAEQLVKSTYGLLKIPEGYTPDNAAVVPVADGGAVQFALQTPDLDGTTLAWQWLTNGTAVGGASTRQLTLPAESLRVGANPVTVRMRDPTSLVRTDPQGRLRAEIAWTVVRFDGPPPLAMERTGGQVRLSWPALYPGPEVQAATRLNPPDWTSLPSTAQLAGERYELSVAPPPAARYFRLRWRLP